MRHLALVACLALVGCTAAQAKADFHSAASGAYGLLTLAAEHPELTQEAADALAGAAEKAAPEDVADIQAARRYITAGNVLEAQALVKPLVVKSAATAPVTTK